MTISETIYVGAQMTIKGTFSVNGLPTDPTTVTLSIKVGGSTTTYTYAAATVTRLSQGIYYKTVELSSAGDWLAVWEGTGACEAVTASTFRVEATGVP